MKVGFSIIPALAASLFSPQATAQTVIEAPSQITLSVPKGAPLRLYLTKRISKREGAPVEAKLLEAVFAFDREVVPAGTVVLGQVSRVQPVRKTERMAWCTRPYSDSSTSSCLRPAGVRR